MNLSNKTAVVTGAGSGFGEGIAKYFAQHSATVALADINLENAQRVAAEIEPAGGSAFAVYADVSQSDSMAALAAQTVQTTERLDIFVNNAGTTHKNGSLVDVDEATFDRVLPST
ncbi:MAG: SDR family NAD(P)-dependent oxidoreductase [Caldilineaceae bacterium]